MDLSFNLELTQEQKLILTQQMQLSIQILQMSTYELQNYIEKELQENPVLDLKPAENDADKNDADKLNGINQKDFLNYLEADNYHGNYNYYDKDNEEISPFNFIPEKKSLKEYLREQINDLHYDNFTKIICIYLIESLDSNGYLNGSLEDIFKCINVDCKTTERCLKIIHSLDPPGIGARNLKECLKLQMERKDINDSNIYKIVDEYLELLAENRYNVIAKNLDINVKKAQEYGDIIKSLEPKPSRGFYTGESTKYITPDAYIKKIDNKYHIIMNDDLVPRLSINQIYKEIIKEENDKEAVTYVKEKLNNAMFLIKSIQQRKTTIYRVLEKIIDIQEKYFDYGEEYLKPMTLKEIADMLNMHESTISRAVRDKYIYTNMGTLKLKDLFTSGVSSLSYGEDISVKKIKKTIKTLIDNEDKKKPLSDQVICDVLNNRGMNISRRTVAKYRESMNIKSTSKRKRF